MVWAPEADAGEKPCGEKVVVVGAGAVVVRTILNEKASIAPGARIGSENKITVVGENATMEVDA